MRLIFSWLAKTNIFDPKYVERIHPLVRVHPVTGWKTLWVNRAMTVSMSAYTNPKAISFSILPPLRRMWIFKSVSNGHQQHRPFGIIALRFMMLGIMKGLNPVMGLG